MRLRLAYCNNLQLRPLPFFEEMRLRRLPSFSVKPALTERRYGRRYSGPQDYITKALSPGRRGSAAAASRSM